MTMCFGILQCTASVFQPPQKPHSVRVHALGTAICMPLATLSVHAFPAMASARLPIGADCIATCVSSGCQGADALLAGFSRSLTTCNEHRQVIVEEWWVVLEVVSWSLHAHIGNMLPHKARSRCFGQVVSGRAWSLNCRDALCNSIKCLSSHCSLAAQQLLWYDVKTSQLTSSSVSQMDSRTCRQAEPPTVLTAAAAAADEQD